MSIKKCIKAKNFCFCTNLSIAATPGSEMAKREKHSDNSMIKQDSNETEAVITRLKEALRVKSDGQMANYLGISRQNIGASRKRDDVPPGWINKVAELTGYSMDWLCFGNGPKMRVEFGATASPPGGRVATPEGTYGFHENRSTGTDPDKQPAEDRFGFGTAVEMLAKIYSSEDELLINTINANIRAFCESIDLRQNEQRSSRELLDLKKRLTTIEKQLRKGKPAGKKK
jgi:hypothetical protein